MLTNDQFAAAFAAALPFDRYLATATASQRPGWEAATARTHITEAQSALIRTFSRRINVLVLSGTWCGDCVHQCPILHRIAEAHPANKKLSAAPGIDLRFLDRDQHPEVSHPLKICGGLRVPTAIFLNEDFDFVDILGDRTLSRYRAMAARQLGPSCPLPGAPVPHDELAATVADWVDQFERIALLLRLSPKLRARHAD